MDAFLDLFKPVVASVAVGDVRFGPMADIQLICPNKKKEA